MCYACASGLSRRVVLAAAPFAALAGCATNPVTGRNQLVGLADPAAIQQMGLQAWAQERQSKPVWNNAAQQERLQRVGRRVSGQVTVPNAQWEFVAFDSEQRNAYVLPGGKVGFYRGIMELAQNDDQLATVMSHEVGHLLGRHVEERYSQAVAQEGAAAVAGAATNSRITQQILGLGLQLGVALPFSRAQESEADRIGVDLMHAAGYDVNQAITFWERMQAAGGSRPPEFLSTHPDPAHRITDLRAYIASRNW
jgi:predicted Zn-dependent protease